MYDIGGRGDLSFNDSAAKGLEDAEAELGVTFTEASPNDDGSNRAELLQLAAGENPLVVAVGFLFEGDAAATAAENPDTNFAVIDSSMLNFEVDPPAPYGDNVAGLVFAEEQGSYLVGVAAALKSESGQIGFIGGVCCFGLIEKFEAGFRAGALSVNPDIEITAQYITEAPDFDGFNQPDQARSSPPRCTRVASTSSTTPPAAPGTACSRQRRSSARTAAPRCGASVSTPISTTPSVRSTPSCRSTSSPPC